MTTRPKYMRLQEVEFKKKVLICFGKKRARPHSYDVVEEKFLDGKLIWVLEKTKK